MNEKKVELKTYFSYRKMIDLLEEYIQSNGKIEIFEDSEEFKLSYKDGTTIFAHCSKQIDGKMLVKMDVVRHQPVKGLLIAGIITLLMFILGLIFAIWLALAAVLFCLGGFITIAIEQDNNPMVPDLHRADELKKLLHGDLKLLE